jgi:hypothetical protein
VADAGVDPARHGRVRARRKAVPAAIELARVGGGTGSTTAGLHRILVPLDGTPDAARAVEQAARWFAGSGVGIVSLHCSSRHHARFAIWEGPPDLDKGGRSAGAVTVQMAEAQQGGSRPPRQDRGGHEP